MIDFFIFPTARGWVGLLASSKGLMRLVLPLQDQEEVLRELGQLAETPHNPSAFGDLPQRITRYLSGERVKFADAVDLDGSSPFQRRVLGRLRRIPYGQTRSYGWVARAVGVPQGPRAVGQAVARNPVPLIIPCHRVVGTNGLGGFGGGLDLKRLLLRQEAGGPPAS
ncbi:MAG: methylated-DNA--[protein]-cysteine S-methyltransferase [Dehalococcoidia bacterium]